MTKKQEAFFELNNEEVGIEDWTTLTEDELFELKESILSTKFGIGGENINFFPNLIDPGKINIEFNKEYIERLPKKITEQSLREHKGNGRVDIIKVDTLNKSHYIIILLPERPLEIDIWQLKMNDSQPYTKYKEGKKIKSIKINKNKFHITNIFTNANKAINQAKKLSILFELGDTSFNSLKRVKEGGRNNYLLDIDDKGRIILKNGINGPIYSSLDELIGRKHSINLNIMEYIG